MDYDYLRRECIERQYRVGDTKMALIDLYVLRHDIFYQLCKSDSIQPEIIKLFNELGAQFTDIFNMVSIPYFRVTSCENLLRNYCISNPLPKKLSVPVATNDILSDFTIYRWEYKNVSSNTIRYFPSKGPRIHLDVTTVDEKKKYDLRYPKKHFSEEECIKIEEYILSTSPVYHKANISRVFHVERTKNNREKNSETKENISIKPEPQLNSPINSLPGDQNTKKKKNKKKRKKFSASAAPTLHISSTEVPQKYEQLPQIDFKDFLVRKATFKCLHNNHHTEDLTATISVIMKDSSIRQVLINAGYCKECNIYFILDSTYERLKNIGVPICRISDEKTYAKAGYLNGIKLAQESLLMQYGYNVSQTEGLTEKVRHKILAVLIDNHIMRKSDIISYLDFFISQRQNQSKFELAVSKWAADRDFVSDYRIGEYSAYGINAIYR